MSCPEYELRIAEWVEHRLPEGEKAALEAHLAACPECRDFAARWRALDATLARSIQPAALPADFTTRLWQRIESPLAGPAISSEALKRQVETEHAARMARLDRRFKSLGSLLDALGLGVLCAGAASAAYLVAPDLIRQALPAGASGIWADPRVLAATVGTVAVVATIFALCSRGGRCARWV
jgi:anti-sigma factor RsiW